MADRFSGICMLPISEINQLSSFYMLQFCYQHATSFFCFCGILTAGPINICQEKNSFITNYLEKANQLLPFFSLLVQLPPLYLISFVQLNIQVSWKR